jgi:hypothetical protein
VKIVLHMALVAAFLLSGMARRALAQTQTSALDSLTANWSDDQRAQARTRLEVLLKAGLPESEALGRLEEWRAKGADPTQALALLTTLSGQAEQARQALQSSSLEVKPGLISATVDALAAGVSRHQLEQVLGDVHEGDLARARILALTTLVAQGFPGEKSAEVVLLAGQRSYGKPELSLLTHSAARLIQEGVGSQELVLHQLDGAIRSGISARELYPEVLRAIKTNHPFGHTPPPESGFNHPVLRVPQIGH